MFKKILGVILGISCFAGIVSWVSAKPAAMEYPVLLQVTAVQGLGHDEQSDREEGYLVCLKNSQGFVYRVHTEDGDLELGDFYVCIVSDNGTLAVYDDTVVQMKYTRVDLFE